MTRLGGVVALGVAFVTGIAPIDITAASKDTDAAVKAMKRQYGYLNDGQYELLYRELHPEQQALLPQDAFLDCYQREASGISVEVTKVKRTYRTRTGIPGTGETARAIAITHEYEGRQGLLTDEGTTTIREFKVGKHWKWVLKADRFEECSGYSSPP